MKSICIVGAMNIKHMTLISLYTKYFDENNIPYDLIYMDRYEIDEKSTAMNKYRLPVEMNRDWSKIRKLFTYIKFRRYAKSIIMKNKYDLIITWQTTTAYLIADLLITKYKGRHIINVRDYIIEKLPFINQLLKTIVNTSVFTTISSQGFLDFLPKAKYTLVNSINEEVLKAKEQLHLENKGNRIKIGFIGNCRTFKENRFLIEALKNDERFELWYCGTNSDVFRDYAIEKNINNLYTLPSFEPDETIVIIKKFDMVNSLFGSNDLGNRTLMSIRLYTALELEIPLLVSGGTYISKAVNENQLGLSVYTYQNLGEQIVQYINNLDRKEFSKNCISFMEKCRIENKAFTDKLKDVIN